MPEASPVAAPAPAPTQSPNGPSAVADFAREIAESTAAVAEPTPDPTPTETPSKEPKPVDNPEPKQPADAAPKEAPKAKSFADLTQSEIADLIKAGPSKAYKLHEAYVKKTETQLTALQEKVKALESKPVEAPGDVKKVEAYEKQIQELSDTIKSREKVIAELDFSRSPDFQKRFISRYNNAQKTAEAEIAQLTVTEGDTQRAATAQDFALLMQLPLRDQITRARAMFGDAADVFFQHRNILQNIRREGMEALQQANEDAEQLRSQRDAQTKEEQRAYATTLESEEKALATDFPDLFGDTDNPQASAAFKKGLDFAKKALDARNSMSPTERASHDAILKMTHAGYRRAVVEIKSLNSENKALKDELAKYRKSDPDTETTGKAPKPEGDDDIGGIDKVAGFIAGVK